MLKDLYGRTFPYLRLSITDICNFKCSYCLPDGYHSDKKKFLSLDEIDRIMYVFTKLGVKKVRLTGGEPTVRKDFINISKIVKSYKEIENMSFTTNGYILEEISETCADIGFKGVNVSLDSLNELKFKEITGTKYFKKVLLGIKKSLDFNLNVKINVVLIKPFDEKDLIEFINFVEKYSVTIRFIELMKTNDINNTFFESHISHKVVSNFLIKNDWCENKKDLFSGPAIEYSKKNYAGKIGVIAPYSKGFCNSCNRLRISSLGELYLCLFGENSHIYSLRPFLQTDNQIEEMIKFISIKLKLKKYSHNLLYNNSGKIKQLSNIGG